jgi:hypothetical protein
MNNIVLVHGAFVDGAHWEAVYKILKRDVSFASGVFRFSEGKSHPSGPVSGEAASHSARS